MAHGRLFFVGHVMADRTPSRGTEQGVVTGKMAADTANGSTLQATVGL